MPPSAPWTAALAVLVPLGSAAFDGKTGTVPTIGKIQVVANEVFDEEQVLPWSWVYRVANKIHIRTREEIIRRELLFAPGDPLDEEALAQTERNLRSLVFIRDARIEVHPQDQGTVDVRVVTFDAWSTIARLQLAKVGDRYTWSIGAAERNLLGRGKWIEILRRSGIDRDDTALFYYDPRLAGSRFQTLASVSDQSDGAAGELVLARPFFALTTKWAFRFHIHGFDQLDPLYAHGVRVADLRHVRRWGEVEVARAIERRERAATRLHIAYRGREDEVAGDLRDFGILELGVSTEEHRFLKLTHVNRFEEPEDFNLGTEAAGSLGISSPTLGGGDERVWFFSLQARRGLQFGGEHFLRSGAVWYGRHRRGRLENAVAEAQIDYINKLAPRWLIVGSGRFTYGTNLDPEVQLRLGVESGLRGYPANQFVGNRSLLVGVEQRLFLADDVAQLLSFGAAVFFDTGYAWPEGESTDLRDLKSDVGVSLLLGRNRLGAGTPGVRLDLAYALNPLPDRSPWLFSFGTRVSLWP